MAGKTNLYAYLVAANAHKIEIVDTIETQEEFEEFRKEIILKSSSNPEMSYILKESFSNLSDEAKQVIRFIFDAPEELLKVLAPAKANKVSVRKFKNLLYSSFGSKVAKSIFREVKKWLREM